MNKLLRQEFVRYYNKEIHPDMDRMANWAFQSHGFKLVTSNQAESFNAFIKLWTEGVENRLDTLVLILLEAIEFSLARIRRGQYGDEDSYTLREFLKPLYVKDPTFKLPEPIDKQDIINKIKSRLNREKAVITVSIILLKIIYFL